MRPVPSTQPEPSGNRTTGASVVPPQRHPAANFGTLASVSSATMPLVVRVAFVIDAKRARRRPARFDISEIKSVKLRPQYVALVAQCLHDAFLVRARRRVVESVLDREGRVLGS